jgi:hypothetical protein
MWKFTLRPIRYEDKILCHSKVQEIKLIRNNLRKNTRCLSQTQGNPSFLVADAATFMRAKQVISIQKQEESVVYVLGETMINVLYADRYKIKDIPNTSIISIRISRIL